MDLPINSSLERSLDRAPLWLCHSEDVCEKRKEHWQNAGAELIECQVEDGSIVLQDKLAKLANRGLTRIFCEGGGILAASLIKGDMVDEIVGFQAGVILGAEGQPAIGPLGLEHLQDAHRYGLVETTAVGQDVMNLWRRKDVQS